MAEEFEVMWNGAMETEKARGEQRAAAPAQRTDRTTLTQEILSALAVGELTAPELCEMFTSDSHTINGILYALQGQNKVKRGKTVTRTAMNHQARSYTLTVLGRSYVRA